MVVTRISVVTCNLSLKFDKHCNKIKSEKRQLMLPDRYSTLNIIFDENYIYYDFVADRAKHSYREILL